MLEPLPLGGQILGKGLEAFTITTSVMEMRPVFLIVQHAPILVAAMNMTPELYAVLKVCIVLQQCEKVNQVRDSLLPLGISTLVLFFS